MIRLFCFLVSLILAYSLREDNPKYLRKSLSNSVNDINLKARTVIKLTEDEEEFWERELTYSNSLNYSYIYDSKKKKYVPSKSSSRIHSSKQPVEHGESIITFHKSNKVDLIKMLDLIKSVHEYKESLVKSNLLKKIDSNDSKRASTSYSSISDASKKTPKKKSPTASVASNHNKSNNKAHNKKSSTNGTKKSLATKEPAKEPTSHSKAPKEVYKLTSNTVNSKHVDKKSASSASALSTLTPPPIAIPKEIFGILSSSTKEEKDNINISIEKTSDVEITINTGCSKVKYESLQNVVKNILKEVSGTEKVNNPNSPQSKAMNWVLSNSNHMIQKNNNNDSITYCPEEWIQRYAITVLYYSLGGENWLDKHEFLVNNKHECEWNNKIICNEKNEIIEIIIGNNNMEGKIPNEIGIFNKLKTLSLANGKISGPIPDAMYNIHTLQTLKLNNNEITGKISKALYGSLKNLKILHLNNNKLRGNMDADIGLLGDSLMSLRLDNNDFYGLIRRELKDLVHLKDGTFHNNAFTGRIPSRMCNLFESKNGGNLSVLTSDCGNSNKVTCDCCTMCY